jgi:hypothetical protein
MTDRQITLQIDKYLKNRTGDDDVLRLCSQQRNISDAIHVAVRSCDETNTMHSHQCKIGYTRLNSFLNRCLRKTDKISQAEDFDSLYRIIENCKIDGISKLTFYDIAHRIARFKRIRPQKVYLHQGTLWGARLILNSKGNRIKGDTLTKKDLGKPFERNDINYEDIEDILCHYIWKERGIFGYD